MSMTGTGAKTEKDRDNGQISNEPAGLFFALIVLVVKELLLAVGAAKVVDTYSQGSLFNYTIIGVIALAAAIQSWRWYQKLKRRTQITLQLLLALGVLLCPVAFKQELTYYKSLGWAWVAVYVSLSSLLLLAFNWSHLFTLRTWLKIALGIACAAGVATMLLLSRYPLIPCDPTVRDQEVLTLHGSNTTRSTLAMSLAEGFLSGPKKKKTDRCGIPNEDKAYVFTLPLSAESKSIRVQAHKGLPGDFSEPHNGICDLVMEPLSDLAVAHSTTTPLSGMEKHVLGTSAVVVIVNKANPIKEMSKEKIGKVFAGYYTEWTDLHFPTSPPGKISLYVPKGECEERSLFTKLVLGEVGFSQNANGRDYPSEIADAVATDPFGIGFVDWTVFNTSKKKSDLAAVAISDTNTDFVSPSSRTIETGEYSLSYRLYLYNLLGVTGAAEKMKEFARSPTGQAIFGNLLPPPPELSSPYHRLDPLAQSCRDLSDDDGKPPDDIHFGPGHSDLDNRTLDEVVLLADFIQRSKGQGETVRLLGFADDSGSPQRNDELSLERARIVESVFNERHISTVAAVGLGSRCPLDQETSSVARAKNRRVEVWVRK